MDRFSYRMQPFGAELIDDERARFRLWAPKLRQLTLEFENRSSHAMTRDDDGWFEIECAARANVCYRYRIDNDLVVPDPASRWQHDDVHGWSVLIDPSEYSWQQANWLGRPWHEIVIYELHVGCCGGFSGVERQLPQLAELGITAIELMPIGDFSGRRNWGYDGVLPFAPDTAYGSPRQLKQLIDRAHQLGICVYLDVVYNHFGPDGNYLHVYAPNFFNTDKTAWGDRIDFSERNVREFFTQNALYWLHEYRFDGLRFDAVHAIDDASFLDEMAARVRASTEPGRHIHLMLENERNAASHLVRDCHRTFCFDTQFPRFDAQSPCFDAQSPCFDAQWNDDWHNVMHVLLTGEHEGYYENYRKNPEKKLARSLAEGFIYQGEPSPTHDNRPRGEPSADLPPTAFINFLQNHDQIGNRALGERLITLTDESNWRAAVALQLLMPAIPLLFMGEPWQVRSPFLFFTDFHGDLARAVYEGRASEFAAFAAFQNEQQRARIPDPNAIETFTASIPPFPLPNSNTETFHPENSHAENSKQRDAASAFYRELLQLRHRYIIPWLQHCRAVAAEVVGEAAVVASWRFDNNALLKIATNFSDDTYAIEPLETSGVFATETDLFASGAGLFESRSGAASLAAAGKLAPHCTVATLEERDLSA